MAQALRKSERKEDSAALQVCMSAWGERFHTADICRTVFLTVPYASLQAHCHLHVSQRRKWCWEFRAFCAEDSEGPGLEPWQPAFVPAWSPSVRPWGVGWWTQFIKNQSCERFDESRSLRTCEGSFVSPNALQLFVPESLKSHQELPGRLAKGWLMRLCSMLPAGSQHEAFSISRGGSEEIGIWDEASQVHEIGRKAKLREKKVWVTVLTFL